MAFKTDGGGIALKLNDCKLAYGTSTWNTRLSQIGKMTGKITICTYSLPDLPYIQQILDKRPYDITLIAHERFRDKAEILMDRYPDLEIHLRPNVHAKYVLIEPQTVWLSSENFGQSGWFEFALGIHSKELYKLMLERTNRFLEEDEFFVDHLACS